MRMDVDIISKALAATDDEDAFAALDAMDQLGFMAKPPGLMDAINTMRCSVCWARPTILTHTKCVKFLTKTCKAGKVCGDTCNKFLALLQKRCWDPNDPKAQDRCDLYKYITGKDCPEPNAEDTDGDGHPDDADAFPEDPKEWSDKDGDGVGDNSDPDRDGDGVNNDEDAFPDDPKETKDSDGDGIGDNADADRDGDGHENKEDKFPDDPKEWADKDGDGIGDNADPDRDGDGVNNEEDAFPDDPKETKDSDGDGIGDNADTDRDGDGCENADDQYPDDPEKCKDGETATTTTTTRTTTRAPTSAPEAGDRDGDGCSDDVDAFPDDPEDCKDSDGDGVGDSKDPWPLNPKCFHATEPCEEEGEPRPKRHVDPATLNKVEQGLPSQGYDEHSHELVEHNDGQTYSGDWGAEWPEWNHETEQQSIARICKKHPHNDFCRSEARKKNFNR